MKAVFADTFYWIALANPRDEWHQAARNVASRLGPVHILTTDEILVEFLTFFSNKGALLRDTAGKLVQKIMSNPNVSVVPQTRESFLSGFRLYQSRTDKQYSMTDCISMETMRSHGLQEVLTHDDHFRQEGFTILLTDKNA
ncbi:MAG: PIN domain-containing protein [Gemmataceae bacterium]|nr:PIN domain-containing protein [Gemmataceae bacterium]